MGAALNPSGSQGSAWASPHEAGRQGTRRLRVRFAIPTRRLSEKSALSINCEDLFAFWLFRAKFRVIYLPVNAASLAMGSQLEQQSDPKFGRRPLLGTPQDATAERGGLWNESVGGGFGGRQGN